MNRPTISLVLPVYDEAPVLGELARRLAAFLAGLEESWEVIFVDDGSTDGSFDRLRELCLADQRYRLVRLSRNFGHQLAITAGLDYARGDAVVVMDADLQDPPDVVREMIDLHRQGFDVVYGVRVRREGEGLFKRCTAAVFYRVLRVLVGVPIPLNAGDFRLMSRRVVVTMRALRETNRFVRGMVAWIGFRQTSVQYVRKGRAAGKTHYPLRRMIRFALDGILSFSTLPLRLAIWLGAVAGLLGIAVAIWAVAAYLAGRTIPGWATIMVAVALASSAQLMMTGVLGEYVGRIYDEVKRRPLYVVMEEVNAERERDNSQGA